MRQRSFASLLAGTNPAVPVPLRATPRLPLCSKTAQDADAQVLRSCVLLDELIEAECSSGGPEGPIVVAQVGLGGIRQCWQLLAVL